MHEAHVGNDTQHVVFVLVKDANGLFVGTRQFDFGTSSHTQRLLVCIECLLGKHLALLQYHFVEVGEG